MMHALLISFALTATQPVRVDTVVHTEPGEIPQLKVAGTPLPLEHTAVRANIEGYAARVEVTQRYMNPHPHPIEAIYVFPLPENSAVDDMKMIVGERIIQAQIKKRDDARRTYNQAKNQGKTAALLEQERPNIFTQSVANIAPGKRIEVVVSYIQDLTYDAGEYEFVFPMVVGPRFIPAGVSDAARITPPIAGEGSRTGRDISIEVIAKAGLPIKGVDVPTHDTALIPTFDGTLHLKLAEKDSLPNRDFVMRYHVDGKEPEATALSANGYLTLLVHPPTLDVDKLVGQRELVFVVDVSGSMHGVPLAMCKDAMREALKGLRPTDTFNILAFSGWTGQAFASPRPANDANIADGLKFITGLQAGGGTYMADAIKAALSPEVAEGRTRYVFFMTDGYVGNEDQILAATRSYVNAHKRAKVFGFGVGSSVNRYLLDGLGKSGEGLSVYATTREDPALAVNKFYRYIDAAILQDVSIDWNGLPVSEVYPKVLPDLFASHPLTVHARYAGQASGKIFIRATKNGKRIELPVEVTLADKDKSTTALASLWARSKIGDLERDLWNGEAASAVQAITELGLDYRLVTKYTSFVAVDHDGRVQGPAQTIVQPQEAPEGVNLQMATGGSAGALGLMGKGIGGGGLAGSMGIGMGYGRAAAEPSIAAPLRAKREADRSADEEAPKDAEKKAARPPSPLLPRLDVSGGLTLAEVQAVFAAHKTEIDKCLEKTNGPLTLRWIVGADGHIQQPKISGAGSCLVDRLNTWKFPAAANGKVTLILWTLR